MSRDWIKGRVTVPLAEAWANAFSLPPVKERATELKAELPKWPEHDREELALEIIFSNAGVDGDLAFRGINAKGERCDIPATYFDPSRVIGFTLQRGFDAECNEITFAALHDVQDMAFQVAGQQTSQYPELYHDWREVEVVAVTLAAFLDELHSPDKARRAERNCSAYLVQERKSFAQAPIGREDYQDHCLEKWPGLTKRAFLRAWNDAKQKAPAPTWDRPGPRSKVTRAL